MTIHKMIKKSAAIGLTAVLTGLMLTTVFAYDTPITVQNENADLGDITVQDDDHPALTVVANDGRSANVNVGNLTNLGDDYTLQVEASEGGSAQVSVVGDVYGDSTVAYVRSQSGATAEVRINGDATGDAHGIVVVSDNGRTHTEVNGNVRAESIGMLIGTDHGGSNTVLVSGDVSGQDVGLLFYDADGGSATNHIVVEGTVSCDSDGVAIAVNNDSSLSPGTITVWKAELNRDGHVGDLFDEQSQTIYASPELEANIRYIIKVNQPGEGATLRATRENGAPLATVQGLTNTWEWAHEGDKVLLKIDLEDGYQILGAYGDAGKVYSLMQDENGDYYIIVPKGGGISLSVKLDEVSQRSANKDNGGGSEAIAIPKVSDAMILSLINSTPVGGTVTLSGLSGTGLSPAVVQALLLRRDITVILTYYFNGVLFRVVIPAGEDISTLLNEAGGIDFSALSAYFGAEAVVQ